ncbi:MULTISPECIES: DNA-processing protein DprA [Burkholderia cepacia complex]|uniref:DNA-processing protein DprA n=1 Tax=Burkholderia cepacia complex TaxID=87882 RepID=UPI001908A3C4|nr:MULTISPECIES: DNA-processing protein DprA [Burkholderia cepacia complex]MBJ9751962.1 DNA-protecting protein DprA [Burkholderia cepacia]MBU9552325.1 DNA-protecting protein DprA [Burkholderia multivorans]
MSDFDEAAILFLGLARLKGVGFKTLRDLGEIREIAKHIHHYGSDFVETASKGASRDISVDSLYQLGESAAETLARADIRLLRFGEPRFPTQFAELDKTVRPLWFFYRGNLDLLASEAVAVVGTRSPSVQGEFLTRYAVSALQEVGTTIVSGLAKGVDEIAHDWALSCGLPNISVLGTGLLKSYPAKNAELAGRIVNAGGLLISEYMPDAQPSAENFVWRNRLQAALAKCVVAPEWKRSSGTAHTIRFAKRFARLTINLTINGMEPPRDHGEADQTFEVPRAHAAFIETLRKVAPQTGTRVPSLQQSLF